MRGDKDIAVPVVLLGLSRSGKTSAGKLLAEKLCWSFYDTDEIITLNTGLTPRQLCRQKGIQALYAAEAAALRKCCGYDEGISRCDAGNGEMAAAVIAAGGGICDNRGADAVLAAIPQRIFLYAEETELFARLTLDAQRTGSYPAFLQFLPVERKIEAEQLFAALYERRTEWYRKCCTGIVYTEGLESAAVAEKCKKVFLSAYLNDAEFYNRK